MTVGWKTNEQTSFEFQACSPLCSCLFRNHFDRFTSDSHVSPLTDRIIAAYHPLGTEPAAHFEGNMSVLS